MVTLTYFPEDVAGRTKIFTYAYNEAGNLLSVTDTTTATSSPVVVYSDFNSMGKYLKAVYLKTSGASVDTSYTYNDDTGRLDTLITKNYADSNTLIETLQNLSYVFHPDGTLWTLTDGVNNITHSYVYDPLKRLTQATGAGTNGYQEDYGYDSIGNITSKISTEATSHVGAYLPDYAGKPHTLVTAGPFTFTYDANGNLTARTGGSAALSIDWNVDNKPSRVNTTYITYDGNGARVKKGSAVYFGEIYEERNGTGIYHIFAGSTRVASLRLNGTAQFYHGDHLGSASVITNENAVKTEKIQYVPFGSYRTADTTNNPPLVKYTFTDQEYDSEYGLYNYKARLYDPVVGRFISADGMVPEPGNLQAFNRYSYCVNNPVVYVDPSGNSFLGSFFSGLLAGIAFAAVMIVCPECGIVAAGMMAGAVGGASSAAFSGAGLTAITQGAMMGAALGGVMAGLAQVGVPTAVLIGAGAGAAYATGGPQGLLEFGAGLAGGLLGGAATAAYLNPGTSPAYTAANQTGNGYPQQSTSDIATNPGLRQRTWFEAFKDNMAQSLNGLWSEAKKTFSGIYGDVAISAIYTKGVLVNVEGNVYQYSCWGPAAGISAMGGGTGFVPGDYYIAGQVSGLGPVAPALQVSYVQGSGFSAEAGLAFGWRYGVSYCHIDPQPINR
jgi:RHS repeat-associated protein